MNITDELVFSRLVVDVYIVPCLASDTFLEVALRKSLCGET
jgi:hypothetical protein